MTYTVKITRPKVKKLIKTVDDGLCNGVGEPIPGQMCVEAAVCYALGLPHGDNPQCVSPVLRQFKIPLNDSVWSDNQARAQGLRKLAVLQLDTDTNFNHQLFTERLVIGLMNQIISELPSLPEEVQNQCRLAKTLDECKGAVNTARAAAYAAADAADAARAAAYAAADAANANATHNTARAAAYAADAARAAAYAAARAAYAAADAANANATHNTARAAAYAADAARAAAYAADATHNAARAGDEVLFQMAKIAEKILIEMKVPGVKYLDLLEV